MDKSINSRYWWTQVPVFSYCCCSKTFSDPIPVISRAQERPEVPGFGLDQADQHCTLDTWPTFHIPLCFDSHVVFACFMLSSNSTICSFTECMIWTIDTLISLLGWHHLKCFTVCQFPLCFTKLSQYTDKYNKAKVIPKPVLNLPNIIRQMIDCFAQIDTMGIDTTH